MSTQKTLSRGQSPYRKHSRFQSHFQTAGENLISHHRGNDYLHRT